MRAVVQRVTKARVSVDGETLGELDRPGLVVLLGIGHQDSEPIGRKLASKVWELRIFDGQLSASDLSAPILVVSQFTLYADTKKGRRPSWSAAAPGAVSEPLVDAFVASLRDLGARVSTGRFGAQMQVELTNDGPMTLIIDTDTYR